MDDDITVWFGLVAAALVELGRNVELPLVAIVRAEEAAPIVVGELSELPLSEAE